MIPRKFIFNINDIHSEEFQFKSYFISDERFIYLVKDNKLTITKHTPDDFINVCSKFNLSATDQHSFRIYECILRSLELRLENNFEFINSVLEAVDVQTIDFNDELNNLN